MFKKLLSVGLNVELLIKFIDNFERLSTKTAKYFKNIEQQMEEN